MSLSIDKITAKIYKDLDINTPFDDMLLLSSTVKDAIVDATDGCNTIEEVITKFKLEAEENIKTNITAIVQGIISGIPSGEQEYADGGSGSDSTGLEIGGASNILWVDSDGDNVK